MILTIPPTWQIVVGCKNQLGGIDPRRTHMHAYMHARQHDPFLHVALPCDMEGLGVRSAIKAS